MNELKYEDLNETIKKRDVTPRPKKKIKRIAGIVAPPILMLIMYFIYTLFGMFFGAELGWYLGLFVYWMLCGLIFSNWLIGFENIKKLSSPQKFKPKLIPAILFPVFMALIFRFISGIEFDKISILGVIFLVISAFGNGTFEEILWRGVYMELYPNNNFLRIIYPTIWYALFHFASGSLSPNSNALGLVIGSAFFGIYLSLLAKWTNTIWWSILSHILGAFVMIA
ncbi:MAG: CPBP family intramembrane glutamic endopeptidase [Promethearchaeota archaeon]